MCPWTIRSWLLWRSTASDAPVCLWWMETSLYDMEDWRTGELESPRRVPWPEDGFGLLSSREPRQTGCGAGGRPRSARPARVRVAEAQSTGRPGRAAPGNAPSPASPSSPSPG